MSVSTYDVTGDSLLFEVTDQAVALPGLPSRSDSLISVGCLLEAGYQITFRLPTNQLLSTIRRQNYQYRLSK